METKPGVSVIIPSLNGELSELVDKLGEQTYKEIEIIKIIGVKPNGRARNHGVKRATGEILLFIDDDAMPGDRDLIKKLIAPLISNRDIHITGASKLLSPDASFIQKRIAREIPRIEHRVVKSDLVTNPGIDSYTFSEITTTCCAMRRVDFEKISGFNENLIRGVDTEFFFRARTEGFQFLLVANSWAYHNPPGNLIVLFKKYFQMGIGHSQETRLNPERGIGLTFSNIFIGALYLFLRSLILIPNIFIPYSFAYKKLELSFKPIKAIASYVNSTGYVYGYFFKPIDRGSGL